MSRALGLTMLLALLALAMGPGHPPGAFAQQEDGRENPPRQQPSNEPQADGPTEIERGEYLVHHVAMCIYCHTPRNAEGQLDRFRLLQGAPMPVSSPIPRQEWCVRAPDLTATIDAWGREAMERFLETGQPPRGQAPRPPMPPYRMTAEDARAVAAYLDSLNSRASNP